MQIVNADILSTVDSQTEGLNACIFGATGDGPPYDWMVTISGKVTETTAFVIGITSEGSLMWNRKTSGSWIGWKTTTVP